MCILQCLNECVEHLDLPSGKGSNVVAFVKDSFQRSEDWPAEQQNQAMGCEQ